ncbi:MAG: transcription termination factor NusA [Anaerolineae bacterium]|nr:transcription termination factor NusA [Anaerolineae bacterium]
MKKEFALAFNEVLDDKQLPKEVVLEALEAAMVSAYRKTVNASTAQDVRASLDLETGSVIILAEKEVVDSVQDDRTEVVLEEALKADPEAELGSIVLVESTPKDFGRVAAQTARQVIQQRIREAERDAQYEYYHKQLGEIVNGVVQATNPRVITLGLDRKAEGIMPRNHQIPGERFRVHDRVRALLAEVKLSPRGPQITLSRGHRNFLRRLLEDEVPEIYHGLVEIRSIAREPGYRSKVAVAALQPGIDPVGACVGIRGVRIQAIVRELHDEKIDVIEWSNEPTVYIAKALSPARVTAVFLTEGVGGTKTATVVVPEDQLSLAIGRDGQNARLAAKLTSWRIDIKSLPEAAAEALHKIENNPAYVEEKKALGETIPSVEAALAKKAEGRPVTPEEYTLMGKFIDLVERGASDRQLAAMDAEKDRIREARKSIPDAAFDIPLDDLGLAPSLTIKLTGEGYSAIGDLMLQLNIDADVVLKINGVGPKALTLIEEALAEYDFPVEEVVEELQPEAGVVEGEAEAATSEEEDDEIGEQAALEDIDMEAAVASIDAGEQPGTEDEESDLEVMPSIEDVFARTSELLETPDAVEASTEEEQPAGKSKKSKKKKFREIVYDPDHDVTIVKRKRKRGTGDWSEEDDWNI